MNRKFTAISLSLAITSTSFAQVSQNYCAAIAQNETQQIQILGKIKSDFTKSAKLRTINDGVFAVSGAAMTVGSIADLIKDPTIMNAIGLLVDAGYTYLNVKQAQKETQTGKDRAITLDDLIAKRTAILAKVSSQQNCSPELMASTLADLLVERVAIEKAGLETINKLLAATQDQKSTSAIYMTGIGAVGLVYSIIKLRAGGYPLFNALFGFLSFSVMASGGYTMTVDYFTLRPVINDLVDAKAQTEAQLAKDIEQITKLGRAKLN